MATTDGLTLATTEVKSGSGGFWVTGGSVHSGLVGAVTSGGDGLGVGVGLAGADGVVTVIHPLPMQSDMIRIRLANKYFMLTFFMSVLL